MAAFKNIIAPEYTLKVTVDSGPSLIFMYHKQANFS